MAAKPEEVIEEDATELRFGKGKENEGRASVYNRHDRFRQRGRIADIRSENVT